MIIIVLLVFITEDTVGGVVLRGGSDVWVPHLCKSDKLNNTLISISICFEVQWACYKS